MNQDTTLPAAYLERGFRTLAHDWRNVLNGINLQILSAQTAGDEKERDADLAEIHAIVAHATKMLSALTRKISGPVLHRTVYPTNFLVEDLSAALEKQSDRVSWSPHAGQGNVNVDYDALLQALSELTSNSLRYLPEGKTLRVETQETPDAFSVVILEETAGPVAPADWGLHPFASTEKNRLGLGIYYARRVAEAHGGSLSFDFLPEDSTLRTVLRLPLVQE